MGYAPTYLERAAKLETNNYVGRIRECLCFAFGFLILFLSIEKVFLIVSLDISFLIQ